MNESDLENELRTLRPAAPSCELEARIGRELDGVGQVKAAPTDSRAPHVPGLLTLWLDRLLWTGLGAAAMAAVMVSQKPKAAHESPKASLPLTSASLQPVLASEEDMGWQDEGVHFDVRGQPMLKQRRTVVERQAWADLQHAGVVQTEVPRQEVKWTPVSLH